MKSSTRSGSGRPLPLRRPGTALETSPGFSLADTLGTALKAQIAIVIAFRAARALNRAGGCHA
jgi:hypothetical protein